MATGVSARSATAMSDGSETSIVDLRPRKIEMTASPDGGTTAAVEDESTLAALRRGDKPTVDRVVRSETPRLLATARRLLGNEEEARDCVQETFMRGFASLDQFDGRARLATWLYRICVNSALMKLRAQKRRREHPIDDLLPLFDDRDCRLEPGGGPPAPVSELLERRETRAEVRAAIDALPESHRQVLLLRDIEELSTSEAAACLEISVGAAKVRLHRARAALKKLLEPLMEVQ